MRGVQIWRSGSVQSHAEFLDAPAAERANLESCPPK
jgi:hypothetical protein